MLSLQKTRESFEIISIMKWSEAYVGQQVECDGSNEMLHVVSHIWILGPQLFEKGLGGVALLRKCVTEGWLWGFKSSVWFPVCSLYFLFDVWDMSLQTPASMSDSCSHSVSIIMDPTLEP